ncbi:MAG: hypothetical protein WD176_06620, partial [Pirellulales bacterium]
LRSAARLGSYDDPLSDDDRVWNKRDPNLPKSPWWLTEKPARGVGFRLLRTLAEPSAADRAKFYETDVESIVAAVDDRLKEGRGIKERGGQPLADIIGQIDAVQKKRETLEKKK